MVDDRIIRIVENDCMESVVRINTTCRKVMKKKNTNSISSSGNYYACTICKKFFKNHLLYRKHLKIHEVKLACPICEKSFLTEAYLIAHMLSHTNSQNYQCHLCPKRFAQKSNLNQHLKFHTNKKTHVCGECGKDFYQQEHLKTHMRQHTNERPYQCEICDKSFNIKSSLQRHMNCHTGAKPFICDICNRGYTRRSVLALHVQQVHENKKPYQCSVCDMCFSQKGNLQAHFKRKHIQPKSDGKRGRDRGRKSYKHSPKSRKSAAKNHVKTSSASDFAPTTSISVKLHSLQNGGTSVKSSEFVEKEDSGNAQPESSAVPNLDNVFSLDNDIVRYFNLPEDILDSISDSNDSLPSFLNPYAFSSENFPDDRALSDFDLLLDEPKEWQNLLTDADILNPCSGEDEMLRSSEKIEPKDNSSKVSISLPPCHDYACSPWSLPSKNTKNSIDSPSSCGSDSPSQDEMEYHIKVEVE